MAFIRVFQKRFLKQQKQARFSTAAYAGDNLDERFINKTFELIRIGFSGKHTRIIPVLLMKFKRLLGYNRVNFP
jgi:hypothetical protein